MGSKLRFGHFLSFVPVFFLLIVEYLGLGPNNIVLIKAALLCVGLFSIFILE